MKENKFSGCILCNCSFLFMVLDLLQQYEPSSVYTVLNVSISTAL